MKTRIVLDGLCFPEGPRWHQGRLWFSDMHALEVVAITSEGERETIARVPEQPRAQPHAGQASRRRARAAARALRSRAP